MKNRNVHSIFILLMIVVSFLGILSVQKKPIKNYLGKKLEIVEKNNNYIIQNSIISAKNLKKIVNNQDVKMVFIQSNALPTSFIPKTRVIPYNSIITENKAITNKDNINKVLSEAGINDEDIIIIYDVSNTPYATRLFWTLKVYGHECVKILNGGLSNWMNVGYQTVKNPIKPNKTIYEAHEKNMEMIASIENIKEAMKNKDEIILDVRSTEEYNKGHIPTAINVPYTVALNNNGLFKTYESLQKIYHPNGITPDKSVIYVYCKYGKRASFTYFVLKELLGYNNVKVYDGSFSEYELSGLPTEK